GAELNDPIVKFFVYDGGESKAPRLREVDLDGNGPKFVPNLCLNCHGGDYSLVPGDNPGFADINMKPSFREFDLATFKFPRAGKPENDTDRTTPTQAEITEFKKMNALVIKTKPAPAILELIGEWDKNGWGTKPPWNPPGWNGG